jgi:hypothetical protein
MLHVSKCKNDKIKLKQKIKNSLVNISKNITFAHTKFYFVNFSPECFISCVCQTLLFEK